MANSLSQVWAKPDRPSRHFRLRTEQPSSAFYAEAHKVLFNSELFSLDINIYLLTKPELVAEKLNFQQTSKNTQINEKTVICTENSTAGNHLPNYKQKNLETAFADQ